MFGLRVPSHLSVQWVNEATGAALLSQKRHPRVARKARIAVDRNIVFFGFFNPSGSVGSE